MKTCVHCGRDPDGPVNRWLAARVAAGWSLREAAAAAGVSVSLVSRVENGHEIGLRPGLALAKAYGVPLEDLGVPDVAPPRKARGISKPRKVSDLALSQGIAAAKLRAEGHTLNGIGKALGVSRQRVHQILATASPSSQ